MMIAHQCETNLLADGWAVVTKDHSLSAPAGAHGGDDGQQLYEVLTAWRWARAPIHKCEVREGHRR